jgi:hypothetical protein
MWLSIAARWPVLCLPEPLALYREHTSNTTRLLTASKTRLAEHLRVQEKHFRTLSQDATSRNVRGRALARTYVDFGVSGELEVRNIQAASEHLARALELDARLVSDASLVAQLAHFGYLYCGSKASAPDCEDYVVRLFSALDKRPSVKRLQRRVVSALAAGQTFRRSAARNPSDVRHLLLLAIRKDPKWLLNGGVWSIAAETFLGQRAAGRLRRAASFVHALFARGPTRGSA